MSDGGLAGVGVSGGAQLALAVRMEAMHRVRRERGERWNTLVWMCQGSNLRKRLRPRTMLDLVKAFNSYWPRAEEHRRRHDERAG